MVILEVSELRNPWTDCHKIWCGWLCRGIVGNVTPRDKIQTDDPSGVIPANCWNSTLVHGFYRTMLC